MGASSITCPAAGNCVFHPSQKVGARRDRLLEFRFPRWGGEQKTRRGALGVVPLQRSSPPLHQTQPSSARCATALPEKTPLPYYGRTWTLLVLSREPPKPPLKPGAMLPRERGSAPLRQEHPQPQALPSPSQFMTCCWECVSFILLLRLHKIIVGSVSEDGLGLV